ncbi:MAG: AAA family ATPase [Phycisphaerae bacterium]|nr:AAA family ATPase [Phycisphaerae bacterium]
MKANHRPQPRITSIQLRNWKNFTNVELQLQQRAFLVGPNATGKSNFLDLLRFLRDIVSVGGGFQEAVRRRSGVSSIRSLAARQDPSITVSITLGSSETPAIWEYTLVFRQDNQRRPMIDRELVRQNAKLLLDRPDKEDLSDPARLTQTHLEQVNVNRTFREIADLFGSIRYLHIVPQLIREPDRSSGRKNDPFGGDFIERVATTDKRTQAARLRKITKALQAAVPQLRELELWKDDTGRPHLRGKYEHWRPQGAWQMEEQFSDGSLRLLGLLWALLEGTGPLLLEEPELSLHPDVVRFLPQLFARMQRKSGRQIILSTHSPELLQDSGIGLDEVLLLIPQGEGTVIRVAKQIDEIGHLLDGGLSVAEAVLPRTKPQGIVQLVLFEDL